MKGTAWIWIGMVGIIIFGTFFYIIFNHVKSDFEPSLQAEINETNSTLTENVNTTISLLGTTWQYFLFVMLFGVILWAFIQAQREKSPYE